MDSSGHKIHIIGAGVSGLIAATVLEEQGYKPIVIEASTSVGGRVKTDIIEGYQLDHGFQVLLTAYPAARKYLDFDALNLQKLVPGATLFDLGETTVLGDPLRDFSLLFPTLFSGVGGLRDKFKILELNRKLKAKTLPEIFADKEKTTLAYLHDFGFSSAMINQFFKPFFSGIFLEPELNTSSRMFEFIYKMFGAGYATLPKAGMQAIPEQLKGKLSNTTFQFDTKVASVKEGSIELTDGIRLESDFTIIATEPSGLISNLKNQSTSWKSCDTLYFETKKREIAKPFIGLVPSSNALINNIFYHTSVLSEEHGKNELLSVTVVKEHTLSEQDLVNQIQLELIEYCDIDVLKFLKRYAIPKALPQLSNVKYEMNPSETRLTSSIFIAGDTQLNGSLNAAMISGERAAQSVLELMQ